MAATDMQRLVVSLEARYADVANAKAHPKIRR